MVHMTGKNVANSGPVVYNSTGAQKFLTSGFECSRSCFSSGPAVSSILAVVER